MMNGISDKAVHGNADRPLPVIWLLLSLGSIPLGAIHIGRLASGDRGPGWGLFAIVWVVAAIGAILLAIYWDAWLPAKNASKEEHDKARERTRSFARTFVPLAVLLVTVLQLLPPALSIVVFGVIGGALAAGSVTYWRHTRRVDDAEGS